MSPCCRNVRSAGAAHPGTVALVGIGSADPLVPESAPDHDRFRLAVSRRFRGRPRAGFKATEPSPRNNPPVPLSGATPRFRGDKIRFDSFSRLGSATTSRFQSARKMSSKRPMRRWKTKTARAAATSPDASITRGSKGIRSSVMARRPKVSRSQAARMSAAHGKPSNATRSAPLGTESNWSRGEGTPVARRSRPLLDDHHRTYSCWPARARARVARPTGGTARSSGGGFRRGLARLTPS